MESVLYSFFVPDISMLAYIFGKKMGAIFYNNFHPYGLLILLGLIFWYTASTDLNYIPLIWIAHIGFDRALGYGLKYGAGFNYTHLGKIGIGKRHIPQTI